MLLLNSRIIVTDKGVYQPSLFLIDVAIGLGIVIFVASQLLLNRIPNYAAMSVLFLFISIKAYLFFKYGKLGRPSIELSDNTLTIHLPNDSRQQFSIAISDMREIQVYGRRGRRKYRLIRIDGTFIDLSAMWGNTLEIEIIRFMQNHLPKSITVKLCEPQTFFEEVRGDDPIR